MLILFFLGGCSINGPDVMPTGEAEKLLTQDCLAALILNFPPSENQTTTIDVDTSSAPTPPYDFVLRSLESASYLCNYDSHWYVNNEEMVSVESVESCRSAVRVIQADSYADFVVKYALVRNFICDLKTIRFLEFTEPLQGGV